MTRSMIPHRARPLPLWGEWAIANALAGAIVGFLEGNLLQFAATLILAGLIVGTAQWIVLRRWLPRTHWWILVSALGWIAATQMMIAVNQVTYFWVSQLTAIGGWEVLWLSIINGIVTAAGFGAAQWLILRRSGHAKFWWLVSAVAGGLQGAISASICLVACPAMTAAAGGSVATAIVYGTGWAIYGIVTGLMLQRVMSLDR